MTTSRACLSYKAGVGRGFVFLYPTHALTPIQPDITDNVCTVPYVVGIRVKKKTTNKTHQHAVHCITHDSQ